MKSSSRFHSFLVFLGFVIVATIFWLVMALNDSVQNNFNVKVKVFNAPDSVTFITDVPEEFHVSVRDRGSNLFRLAVLSKPVMSLNFRDYASGGTFRVSKNDLLARLKSTFGGSATILSTSLDSINVTYTTNKGKKVPVKVLAEITPAPGKSLSGDLKAEPSTVMVYGSRSVLDTLNIIYTERIVKRDVTDNQTFHVNLKSIKGVRAVPGTVDVPVNVEALVSKTEVIPVKVIGVPEGESLLLFPAQVTVEYFIPMSSFSSGNLPGMSAEVLYKDALTSQSGKVHVSLVVSDKKVLNAHLRTDSVEYTIVH